MRVATTQRISDLVAAGSGATNISEQAAIPAAKDKNIAIINSRRKPVTAATAILPPTPTEVAINSTTIDGEVVIPAETADSTNSTEITTVSTETLQTAAAAAAAHPPPPSPSSSSASSSSSPSSSTPHQQPLCDPRTARNLFWNSTRAGDVNVQPCPGGATGIAKWRCVIAARRGSMAVATAQWLPATPDLTHCRSLWLNSLEVRVNQPDSSIVSIATDLSQVRFYYP